MRQMNVLLLAALPLFAQPDPNLLVRHTFENDTEGWIPMGQGGSVHTAAGSLAFSYELRPKQFSMAVLPAPPETARLQRLRLRVKADRDTPVVVLLSEKKPGGNYTAIFWAPANTWQAVELGLGDFILADGPNDPHDPDGKLDLDAVEGIAIADMGQFFLGQPDNPDVPIAIERPSGKHTLLIADFEMLSASPKPLAAIDSFDRGFLEWFTMGGVKLNLAARENPLGVPALQAATMAEDGRYGLLVRRVSNLNLAKAQRLTFELASEKETTLMVSLENRGGERYNLPVYPQGKREVFHVSLKLADFEGPGKFDPAEWKSIAIADTLGERNTIWIGKVGVE